jgi:hypothetical protein
MKFVDSASLSVPSILTSFRQQPQLGDLVQDQRKQAPRDRHFRHLKSYVSRMPNDFGPYLDQFLPQGGQSPLADYRFLDEVSEHPGASRLGKDRERRGGLINDFWI